jgi:transposase
MEEKKKRSRRLHPADFKARAVAACRVPGASLAGVALESQLNANLLRRWVKEDATNTPRISRDETAAAAKAPSFVPVAIAGPRLGATAERPIRIQVRRRGLRLTIDWPVSGAHACAAWLQELLE